MYNSNIIKTLKSLSLFVIPIILFCCIIAFIDPYNIFHKKRNYNKELYDIGHAHDKGRRSKIIAYLNNPQKNIILGASEIDVLNERNIPEDGWTVFGFGGASLFESFDVFWRIVKDYDISNVIIAPEYVKFCSAISNSKNDPFYTDYEITNSQTEKAFNLYTKKYTYFFDKFVVQSSFQYLLSYLNIQTSTNKPNVTREEFWKESLAYGREIYCGYKIFEDKKDAVFSEFRRIKHYCDNKNINIRIVLPAQHPDLIKIEYRNESFPTYKEYLSTLVKIFDTIYYFDYPCGLNDSDFKDPFHYASPQIYIDALWKGGSDHEIMLNSKNVFSTLDSLRLTMYPEFTNE